MSRRTLVVEDDPRQAAALVRLLQAEPGFDVVGVVGGIHELRDSLDRCACDIALVDLQLSDGSGIEAIRLLKAAAAPPKVLVLTVVNDSAVLFSALRVGADGYLLKRDDQKLLTQRLSELLAGEVPMSSAVARRVLDFFRTDGDRVPALVGNLTVSEREVLTLLARGHPNSEIAEMRGVTLSTIRTQLSAIYHKLHVRNRTEAVALYHRSA